MIKQILYSLTVTQYFISLGYLFEFFLGPGILVLVGMVLERQFTVSLLQLVFCGASTDAKNLVEISPHHDML